MASSGEVLGMGVGNMSGLAIKLGGALVGIGTAMKMHETVDSDEEGIILSRGQVKIDRRKLKEEFGVRSTRKAQKIVVARAIEAGMPPADAAKERLDRVEYADIRNGRGAFVFFSVRKLRTIKNTRQTTGIPVQSLELQRGKYLLDSSVTWAVEPKGQNSARAILRVDGHKELTERVAAQTAAAARETILDLDNGSSVGKLKSSDVFEGIRERCGDDLVRTYGAVLLNYDILSLAPSEAEVQRKLRFEGADGAPLQPGEVINNGLRLIAGQQGIPDTSA